MKNDSLEDLPIYKPTVLRKRDTKDLINLDPTNSVIYPPRILENIRNLDHTRLSYPVANPNFAPKEFQKEAIAQSLKFLKENPIQGIYNGYAPGLGKTAMTIITMNILQAKRVLVVCPAGLRDTWEEEIRKFSTTNPLTINTIYSARSVMDYITANWCIVSYTLLLKENVFKALAREPWDAIVGDEAHNLTSMRAKRTALFMYLWERISRGWLLSGTPLRRCTVDLFPALNMLMPQEFHDIHAFAEEYALQRQVPWGDGFEYYHGQNLPKLSETLRKNFFIRKTKKEVLTELPPVTYQKITIDCGDTFKEVSDDDASKIIAAVDRGEDPSTIKLMNTKTFHEKRKEAALATIKYGKEFIDNFVDNNIPVMLVGYHHVTLDALMQTFAKHCPLKLDGSVTGPNKGVVQRAFNAGKSPILVMQIQCAEGLNLQENCWTCIFVEWSYNPGEIEQTVDRLNRMGQRFPTNAYFLAAKGSIDDRVFKIVFRKQEMINQVIQSN